MSAEFSIEPAGAGDLLWKPAAPCVWPAVLLYGWVIVTQQVFIDPLKVFGSLAAMGFLRSGCWWLVFRKSGFRMDRHGATLVSVVKQRWIAADRIAGVRFVVPGEAPETRFRGFQKVELDLVGGKKAKHRVAVFRSGCKEKSAELDAVAPALGFETKVESGKEAGFWKR